MNSQPTNQPPEGMTPDNIEGHLNAFRDGYNAATPAVVNPLPTIDEAGVIAVRISENITPDLTAQEQAFFVAGFKECVKYLNESPSLSEGEEAIGELLNALQGLVNDVKNKPNDTRYATHIKIAESTIKKYKK